MGFKTLNKTYLENLAKNPLITKSVTAGVANGLNEVLASIISKDYSGLKGTDNKVIKMVIYGSLILTPLSHNMYAALNKVFGNKLSFKMKMLQILVSVTTITPFISAVFTCWLALINNYNIKSLVATEDLKMELKKMLKVMKAGLLANYPRNVKSSVITNIGCLLVAQNYIQPELWVVFFTFVFFLLGTYQNTKQKIASQKKAKDQ
ncbi:hypothetical protein CLIB1444_04S06370 [[Candida] jaroonii]|uniref:Uncharacterized protein n=1 Tax=[Candida] jaroonii TaxID=467808 RepID=A0ACA9Y7N5_9ASCO|nr:hypothetical protein CLIB1444_04S06370 [[Candida] jaroonii]